MSQHKAPEVLAAARAWLGSDQARDYFFVDYSVDTAISKLVGYVAPEGRGSYAQQSEWDRFHGQVQRAIDKLAAEGLLEKVKASENGPDGKRRRFATYFKPEAAGRMRAERDQRHSEREAENGRRYAVTAEVQRILGSEVGTTGLLPDLTVEQWWELLGRLS